jgi:NAD(P)-dependent dehydrogenase (short-subunit alcohol dehydrogenase family)
MPRRKQCTVAVITGASSGIGRATALELSKRGISVVLASRRKHALNEVADECKGFGVEALVVVTDVTDESAVRTLAHQAFRRFGSLDIWVNNAVVGLYGDFEDVSASEFRRVIETDFFGYVNGARAALPYFRRQGHGILVNVASVLGTFGIPHMSSYVAAKHAIVGFSDALRQELRGSGIRMCTICRPQ